MSQAVRIEQDEALQVEVVNPPRRALSFVNDSLQAVTGTGAGSSVYVGDKGVVMLIVTASSVTTGGVVLLEGCRKDSTVAGDWYTIATINVTANKSYYAQVMEDEWHMFARANVSARTDGTYSCYWGTVPRKDAR